MYNEYCLADHFMPDCKRGKMKKWVQFVFGCRGECDKLCIKLRAENVCYRWLPENHKEESAPTHIFIEFKGDWRVFTLSGEKRFLISRTVLF